MTEKSPNQQAPRRKLSGSSLRWLQLAILNVVFLVGPVGIWYYLLVEDRMEDNTMRIFRALREIDNTLIENVNNLPRVWRNSSFTKLKEGVQESFIRVLQKKAELLEVETQDWLSRIDEELDKLVALQSNKAETDADGNSGSAELSECRDYLDNVAEWRQQPSWKDRKTAAGEFKEKLSNLDTIDTSLWNGEANPLGAMASSTDRILDEVPGIEENLQQADCEHVSLRGAVNNVTNTLRNIQSTNLTIAELAYDAWFNEREEPDSGEQLNDSARNDNTGRGFNYAITLNPAFGRIRFSKETTKDVDCLIQQPAYSIAKHAQSYHLEARCLGLVKPLIELPLSDLLYSVAGNVSVRMDQILIANQEGTIVARISPRITADAKQAGAIATDPFRYDYFNYASLREVLDGCRDDRGDGERSCNEGELPVQAFEHPVTVGATEFLMFAQPSSLQLSMQRTALQPVDASIAALAQTVIPASLENSRWYVIGVVQRSRLLSEALIAPISIAGPLLVLIVIALAAIPLLWLATKGRRSLITSLHFGASLGGGMIILALLTVLCLHALYTRDLRLQSDISIRNLNEDISVKFASELDDRLKALRSRWLNAQAEKTCDLTSAWRESGYPPYEARLILGQKSSAKDVEEGITLAPVTGHRHYSPTSIKVPDRAYYRAHADNTAWLRTSKQGQTSSFYIERIRSFVDGAKEVALSIGAADLEGGCSPAEQTGIKPMAIAEIGPFHSLMNTAVPPHHGFLVVENGSGKVLFHSIDSRVLDENVIDETDGDQQLISLLQSRTRGFLDLSYHGSAIRAYATPVHDVPWTLITFMDDEVVDTLLLETLITSTILVVGFAIFVITLHWLFATLVIGQSPHRSMSWLWYSEEAAPVYPLLLVVVVLLSLYLLLFAVFSSNLYSALHQLMILTPLGIVSLLVQAPGSRYRIKRPYWAFLLILLGLVLHFMLNEWRANLLSFGYLGLFIIATLAAIATLRKRATPIFKLPRQLAPVASLLLFFGPVAGALIYLPAFDAYAISAGHYLDDQTLRALDLREQQIRGQLRRYLDSPQKSARKSFRVRNELCPGTYLDSGFQPNHYFAKLGREDKAKYSMEESKAEGSTVKSNLSTHRDFCSTDAQVQTRLPFSSPTPAVDTTRCEEPGRLLKQNWVSWFVPNMPAFSYESGAIKQAWRNERDKGYLRWCLLKDPNSPTFSARTLNQFMSWFTDKKYFDDVYNVEHFLGRSRIDPNYTFKVQPSRLGFLALSRQDVTPEFGLTDNASPSPSLSMISLITFIVTILGAALYMIARLLSRHLLGAHAPLPPPLRTPLSATTTRPARCHALISPRGVLSEVTKAHPEALVINRSCSALKEIKELTAESTVIVDGFESLFVDKPHRMQLGLMIDAAQSQGARLIVLSRIDPIYWLSTLDLRVFNQDETLKLDREEAMTWSQRFSQFDILLIEDAGFEELSDGQRLAEYFQNWSVSTLYERNVLLNLTTSEMYNSRNTDVIESLIRRGLITEDCPHELIDPAFGKYILNGTEPSVLKTWRKEGRASLWTALWPTAVVIIALLVFFVVSAGRDAVDTALAAIGSIIAALPLLLGVFAAIRGSSSSNH